MPYVTTIPVIFPCDRATVYRALCDQPSYPLWNTGMIKVQPAAQLRPGFTYESETIIAGGQVNRASITVIRLQPNTLIEFENHSGSITYWAAFRLNDEPNGHTRVVCEVKFEFNNFVLNLTKAAIEAMASARIRGDLEALRALIC